MSSVFLVEERAKERVWNSLDTGDLLSVSNGSKTSGRESFEDDELSRDELKGRRGRKERREK